MKEQSNDFVFLMAGILGTYGSSWAAFDILDIGNHNLKAFEPRHAKLFHCQPEQKLAQAFLFPSAEPNLKTRPIIRPENSGYNLNVVVDLCVFLLFFLPWLHYKFIDAAISWSSIKSVRRCVIIYLFTFDYWLWKYFLFFNVHPVLLLWTMYLP